MGRSAGLPPIIYPALATISWGTNAVAGRVLVGEGHIDGITLTLVRFALALPILIAVARLYGKGSNGVDGKTLLVTATLGLLGITSFNIFFYSALGHMEASLVSLIASVATPLTYVLSVALSMDLLTASGAAGVVSSFLGTYLVLGPEMGGSLTGALLALSAALSWSVYTIIVRRSLSGVDQNLAMALIVAWGVLFTIPPTLVLGRPLEASIGVRELLLIIYVAVIPGAAGYTLWNLGVEKVGAAKSAVFIPLVPLTAAVLGVALLGESLTPAQVLGGALIILGIYLVVRK